MFSLTLSLAINDRMQNEEVLVVGRLTDEDGSYIQDKDGEYITTKS